MVTADGDGRDLQFMERALFLAERGRGRTSPNPLVGAVVVSPDGVVVGQGAHLQAGSPHAEVNALDAAGSLAKGATLYCTLEPCCHTGRTGPCVERIAAAGVARVVAAITDPNPLVAGRGFDYLRTHGIQVDVGAAETDARRLVAPFITWITRHRPFVILKSAVSADGFVGRHDSRARLTGEDADRYFHRQRAGIDAIAIGSRSVVLDNPLLTARHVFRSRPLVRVLIDWNLAISAASRVFSTLESGPVIMVVSRSVAESHPARLDAFRKAGVDFELFDDRNLRQLLERLASREIVTLLVEGGPALQTAFVAQGLVDRVQIVRTPVRLGQGVAAFRWPPTEAFGGRPDRELQLGADRLMEWDVHGTD